MKGRHHERPGIDRGPPALILAVFSSPWCQPTQGKLSWGKRPGHGRAACTCSKPSRQTFPRGSRETGDQSRHLWLKVTLLALGAVARHVAVAATRVAGLTTRSAEGTTAVATAVSATVSAAVTALRAVAGNVSDLAALVALLAAANAGSTTLGTLARKMSNLAATVARLLGLGLAALPAQVALLTAVVASRGALGGAVASLVADITAFSRLALAHTRHQTCRDENLGRDNKAMTPEPLRKTDKDIERHKKVGEQVVDARSYEQEFVC
ncbi:hypothetical protein IWZ03DRAFT_28321 [Phyllosticta citriasiana]|uniref:Uncharacterized protein n=1 Tax=Phyllosticta citriasiana TaxID=595635 RepID=A0ABR1L0J2_9PEZI